MRLLTFHYFPETANFSFYTTIIVGVTQNFLQINGENLRANRILNIPMMIFCRISFQRTASLTVEEHLT